MSETGRLVKWLSRIGRATWRRERCWLCGLRSDAGVLCHPCLHALPALQQAPPPPPGIDTCHAGFEYVFPVDRLVQAAKYHADFAAQRAMVASMAARTMETTATVNPMGFTGQRIDPSPAPPALLVPVPLHPLRWRWRGFNQAQRLAEGGE